MTETDLVMFISIERSMFETLCLGVFQPGPLLHSNLGSLEKVEVDEFVKRAMDIFRERVAFNGEFVRVDDAGQ